MPSRRSSRKPWPIRPLQPRRRQHGKRAGRREGESGRGGCQAGTAGDRHRGRPRGTHIFPNLAVKFRHVLDAHKHFANTGQKLISETNTNGLELVTGLLDIDFCLVPQNYWQTHEPPSSRASTSRHGFPTPGDSEARLRRAVSSARCQSGRSWDSTCSGRLSQICSMRSRRSRTLRRSMPNESMRTATVILLHEREANVMSLPHRHGDGKTQLAQRWRPSP